MNFGEIKSSIISPAPVEVETINMVNTVVHVGLDREQVPIPNFSNIQSDIHLLEILLRFARYCEHYNIPVPDMAQCLARAIGIQNGGQYNVLIYDYVNAIPDYPPTQNGRKMPLYGEGRFCNMLCYKMQLYGVAVFPSCDNVTFYFPEFSSYSPLVQRLIFSYGNKMLRYCPEEKALAFDFKPALLEPQPQPIRLTATLKQKINEEIIRQSKTEAGNLINSNDQVEFVQLE